MPPIDWMAFYRASESFRPSTVQALSDFACQHPGGRPYNPRHVPSLMGEVYLGANIVAVTRPGDGDDNSSLDSVTCCKWWRD